MMKHTDIAILASDLRATFGMLKRRLRERGGVGDLTHSQTDVLRWLDRHGSASVSHLAREVGMRPQSMSPIIAALEAEGLVSGSPDPNDGRQTLISLTSLFQDKLAKGRAAREDWLARQIEQLSSDEQAHLVAAAAILRRISEN
ncbi:MarR family winged helix-turn-helix transcriptional regulator [Salinisphaera hydrothermalis]|uniref:MarR family winged helix-turn-helix transcriptional regulator n=1 Tax=Salinisphaera hydrothermalis TaxID=563188 RepID=UPI0033400D3F